MNSLMLGLLAETSVHPGAGRSLGVVDLPVAREEASGYPVIVGSSLKGSLREAAENHPEARASVQSVFGTDERAGAVAVSDARLLLLPVRSLSSASRWVTCPQIIERLGRDLARSGLGAAPPVPSVPPGTALANDEARLFLEECSFEATQWSDDAVVDAILALVKHTTVQDRLRSRLVVLNDEDFVWFTQFGLPVHARNRLENDTKQSKNLWYEETLPPDTLMYSVLLSREPEPLAAVRAMFEVNGYLQAGGNASVGQGWFAVTPFGGDAR